MSELDQKAVDAVAEAWASIDGKLEAYRREDRDDVDVTAPGFTGHYMGYQAEAEEMIRRLRSRGFDVAALEPAGE